MWGVYLVDVFDNRVLLYEQPGQAILEPVPFRKTVRPPVLPDRTDLKSATATVLLTDVYRGAGLPGVARGSVKKLRVVEYYFSPRHMGGLLGTLGVDGPWDIRRVLGTVPVEEDGSALFSIPAQTPVMVQPLDGKGQAMQVMRSWFVGMPGERLSCVGCHEKQNETPQPAPSIAASRGVPSVIDPPDGGPVRGFNFAREVQPVLDKYCVSCHGAPELAESYYRSKPGETRKPYLKGDRLINDYQSHISGNGGAHGGKFSMAYAELHRFVRRPGIEGDMRTFSPMDYHFSTTELGQMLRVGHHGVKLDDTSWGRLAMWADLNAPYHGTWHEIVGGGANQVYQRIRDMRRKYAASGPDADNEEIPPMPAFDSTPVIPVAEPEMKTAPVKVEVADSKLETCSFDLGEGVTLDLVRVPGGTLGGVAIKPFWIGTCEVMNRQFRCFDPLHDSRDESRHGYQFGRRGYDMNMDRQPAVRLSFDEAQAFCRWLAAKTGKPVALPSEQQWEWACRAGTTTPFFFGGPDADYSPYANLGDRTLKEFAACTARNNYSAALPLAHPGRYDDWIPRDDRFDDGGLVSTEAGKYKPNAWGLHDMIGNVWEWTSSPFTPGDPSEMAVRGGSWYDRPFHCTATSRLPYRTYQRVFNVGFRVMFEAKD